MYVRPCMYVWMCVCVCMYVSTYMYLDPQKGVTGIAMGHR